MSEASKPRIENLLSIMEALRDPETGCPWDIQQNFKTIAPYTLEEAYEVNEAIQSGDMDNLKEELGDLLLQVVYHAQMAREQDLFGFDDVVMSISQKMVSRHPHVFGTPEERAKGAVPGFWEKHKEKEKRGQLDTSILQGIALALPALTRAVKLQKKAARVGFDWDEPQQVLDKISEECEELVEHTGPDSNMLKREEEFGDLLFVMTNLARHLQIDPEKALRQANDKFTRRFQHIEAASSEKNQTLEEMSLEEMEELWREAKNLEVK